MLRIGLGFGILAALLLLCVLGSRALADPIPEPDAIFFGQVLRNNAPLTGVTLSLRLGDTPIDQYTIGSNAAAGAFYILRARLFSPVTGEPRPQASAFVGDTVSIFILGDAEPRHQVQIQERGQITEFDISADTTPIPTVSATPVTTVPTSGATTPTATVTARTPTGSPNATETGTVKSPTFTESPTPTPTMTPIGTPGSSALDAPIDASASSIPVVDISAFPDSGVVRIEDELIYFGGKTPAGATTAGGGAGASSGTLNNVIRGFAGTIPAAHPTGVQVTLIPVSTCAGDCSNHQTVAINNLITIVGIALGEQPLSKCLAGDTDHDNLIKVPEIIKAVNNALNGCP